MVGSEAIEKLSQVSDVDTVVRCLCSPILSLHPSSIPRDSPSCSIQPFCTHPRGDRSGILTPDCLSSLVSFL